MKMHTQCWEKLSCGVGGWSSLTGITNGGRGPWEVSRFSPIERLKSMQGRKRDRKGVISKSMTCLSNGPNSCEKKWLWVFKTHVTCQQARHNAAASLHPFCKVTFSSIFSLITSLMQPVVFYSPGTRIWSVEKNAFYQITLSTLFAHLLLKT